jgi:hypothetical protein
MRKMSRTRLRCKRALVGRVWRRAQKCALSLLEWNQETSISAWTAHGDILGWVNATAKGISKHATQDGTHFSHEQAIAVPLLSCN